MKTTIIKELRTVQDSIKDVNNTVCNNPENKKRNRDIDVATLMLFKDLTLLKEFITNPVDTANEIVRTHGDLPYSKDFAEVYKAVNCEHTKDQGMTIGRNKIIANIRKIADEIKSKYKTTQDLVKPVLDSIEETAQLVNGSFDSVTQQRRYTQATENEYFTNFTKSVIDKYFVPESIEVSTGLSLSKFLTAVLIIYNNKYTDIFNKVDETLSELDNDLVKKIAYINANNKYMGTTQFNKTQIVYPDVCPKSIRYNNPSKKDCYMSFFLEVNNSLPTLEGPVDKLQVLKNLVDTIDTRKSELLSGLEKMRGLLESIANKDLNIPAIIDGLVTSIVEPMVNMSITLDDYNSKLDDYTIVMHNLLSIYDKLVTSIENVANVPTNVYYIPDRIYKLVDKTLIKATMDKGNEKKPSSVVYNNISNIGE